MARSNLEVLHENFGPRRRFVTLTTAALATVLYTPINAQIAGSTTVGVEVTELNDVALGWSVKRQILGRNVYNENGEIVGKVDDLIVHTRQGSVVCDHWRRGFRRFWASRRRRSRESIPTAQRKLVLERATKEAIKAMPNFEYSASQ